MILLMGADAPIPPTMMNAAAPEGTPPRRFNSFLLKIQINEKQFSRPFPTTFLPSEAPTRRPSDPIRGGKHRNITKHLI